jgi:hypothetical protein
MMLDARKASRARMLSKHVIGWGFRGSPLLFILPVGDIYLFTTYMGQAEFKINLASTFPNERIGRIKGRASFQFICTGMHCRQLKVRSRKISKKVIHD